jgi:NADPH-dependent 2,4-dienoyl-CoA reductase/sulfur reductase-like enzyme
MDSDNSPDAVPEDGNAERVRRRPAVLVVGAGPTGLLLASELQQRGTGDAGKKVT